MSEGLQTAIREALRSLLNPLARLLLKVGVGAGELRRLVDEAYVHAARQLAHEADGADRPNITHIAVQTGLSRADVTRILRTKGAPSEISRGLQRAQRVLGGWWADPDFHDSRGSPAALSLKGPGASFEELVKRYSGEPRSAAILAELIKARAIRRLSDARVLAVSRSVANMRFDPAGMMALGEQISEHLETLLFNAEHPTRPRFVKRLVNLRLAEKHVARLMRDIEQQLETLGNAVHDEINDPSVTIKPRDRHQPAHGLSVTLYIAETPVARTLPEEESARRRRR